MLVCRICQYFDLYVPVLECQSADGVGVADLLSGNGCLRLVALATAR